VAESVADIIPRVRRAIEGPVPLAGGDPNRLTDNQVEALAADAIADIILLTKGRWGHALIRDGVAPDESWEVDPALTEPEERMIALQVAFSFFFFTFQNTKTSEAIANEGQSWEWTQSAQALVRQIDAVKEARDQALEAVQAENPVLAQYASMIAARDVVAYRLLEPWRRYAPGLDPVAVVGGQDVLLP
jgi:hypothetical protein